MTIWCPSLDDLSGPRYLQVCTAMQRDVDAGRLLPGQRLPTHRDLAARLGVTVGTISRAYAEAERRGLIEATVGRGTFVRAPGVSPVRFVVELREPGVVDLSINRPAIGPQTAALADGLHALADNADLLRLGGYASDGGLPEHRQQVASWLQQEAGLTVDAGQVVIACGAQHALWSAIGALTEPGDLLLTEALGYPGTLAIARQCRLNVQALPIDEQGLLPEAFAQACRQGRPRLLVCVPTLHNPTCAVLPHARRQAIADIARAHDVQIIDDDVYGFLVPDRPPPLAAYAPERTCYVACASKSLLPGLRVGFVVAPSALAGRIAGQVRTSAWMAAPLLVELVCRWWQDGTARRLMDWQREEVRLRQHWVGEQLGRWQMQRHPCAPHVWLHLPEGWRSGALVRMAREQGVAVSPGEAFAVGQTAVPQAVRLSLTACERADLQRALAVLADLLDRPPAGPGLV